MNNQKNQSTKILLILVCAIIIVAALIASIFAIEVITNKKSKTAYNKLGKTETRMIEMLNDYLKENNMTLDKPVAFVRDNGLMRGRAYVFNVPLTENQLDFGLEGGTYSAEILLPEGLELPTMYRCSTFAPDLGSLLFPSAHRTKKLCGQNVHVITFDEESLNNGNFKGMLDSVLSK